MRDADNADSPVEQLCLNCGLCCDGTLFGDVALQAGDDASRLRELGLEIRRRANRTWLLQPCRALNGCACRVYGERPTQCAKFECLLLISTRRGEVTVAEAQRLIRSTRRRVCEIRNLLRKLGDHRDDVTLRRRFREVMNNAALRDQPELAETLWRLGDRYHRLTLQLATRFYPGD